MADAILELMAHAPRPTSTELDVAAREPRNLRELINSVRRSRVMKSLRVMSVLLLAGCAKTVPLTAADIFAAQPAAATADQKPLFLLIDAGGRNPPPPSIVFEDGSTDFGRVLTPRALKELKTAIADSKWETLGRKENAYCDSWADGRDEAYGLPQKYPERVFKPCDTAFSPDDALLKLARTIRAAR